MTTQQQRKHYPTIRLNLSREELRRFKFAVLRRDTSMSEVLSEHARQYSAKNANEINEFDASKKNIAESEK